MRVAGIDIVVFIFFFFKQKTAYEMLRSLVGSEMCIRDSINAEYGGRFPNMGMHHSFSGKYEYQYQYQEGGAVIGRDQMEAIVRTEDQLRHSDLWQRKFCKSDTNEWRAQVCHQLQIEALREHGFPDQGPDQDAALISLRNHRGKYANDPTFYQPCYVKYDRSISKRWAKAADGWEQQGDEEGEEVPIPSLAGMLMHNLDGSEISLLEFLTQLEGVGVDQRQEQQPEVPAGLFDGTKPVVLLAGSIT
eukprot:TRINITY_DN9830_c0_g1_i1.p1 TRINITY_DN9830_c0_g1~~TRINITY_DN9830_c0_g1_i1.p1  ORF type:complete len:247 (-),score=95.15 TRINITY_DN9830_c0_g1_i1:643-1383(-)